MANKTISMTHVKRIIQLRSEGLSKLKISQQIGIHRKTLDDYLIKLELTGKSFQELLKYDETDLAAIVYEEHNIHQPDDRLIDLKNQFAYFTTELKLPGVTRHTLWEEYKLSNPDGYGYSQFCEHFARYRKFNNATMHFDHQPGEYMQIDFAGKHLYVTDSQTGEIIPCPVLVCVLPFSGYPYVEALPTAKQEQLFYSLNRCVEFFGGVSRNILGDNMKQFVIKNGRYEFTFSELVNQWALHYNTNLEVTRPYKPKDKPSVEGGVRIAYLRIYAKLRHETFLSLYDLNKRIQELIQAHIHMTFQKKPGTRYDLFINYEKPQLKPLPDTPFIIKHRTSAKVQMNYHVVLGEDNHRYSVPYQYIGRQTQIVYDPDEVEIFIDYRRIAVHKRDYRKGKYSTFAEHMHEKHLKYNETKGWDADYFLSLASDIGDSAKEVFLRVLESKEFVEQTYLSCKGLKRLSEIYTPARFEAACKRALKGARVNYIMIKNILEKNMDKMEDPLQDIFIIPIHRNIRGKEFYQ